jgi:GntR family transcriptional repressor for pyruvate dehydrogenase complex
MSPFDPAHRTVRRPNQQQKLLAVSVPDMGTLVNAAERGEPFPMKREEVRSVTRRKEGGGRRLVSATAEKLKDIILANDPDTQIGSLPELARHLGVGIVTIQQAARILEHQGLLEVRRGPGGGYYGKRPDEATLERALTAYIHVQGPAYDEAREIVWLLNVELASVAAECTDEQLRDELRALAERIDDSDGEAQRFALEMDIQKLLRKMVDRPLITLLQHVAMGIYKNNPLTRLVKTREQVAAWKTGRHRLIDAILANDTDRARFEADRNRKYLLGLLANRNLDNTAA